MNCWVRTTTPNCWRTTTTDPVASGKRKRPPCAAVSVSVSGHRDVGGVSPLRRLVDAVGERGHAAGHRSREGAARRSSARPCATSGPPGEAASRGRDRDRREAGNGSGGCEVFAQNLPRDARRHVRGGSKPGCTDIFFSHAWNCAAAGGARAMRDAAQSGRERIVLFLRCFSHAPALRVRCAWPHRWMRGWRRRVLPAGSV